MGADSVRPLENQAIIATDLTKWFGEGQTKKIAVNGVRLVAHFGEMLFIVGPSGSGKTTMPSMISGILTASVQLIKALGGGWDVSHSTTAAIP